MGVSGKTARKGSVLPGDCARQNEVNTLLKNKAARAAMQNRLFKLQSLLLEYKMIAGACNIVCALYPTRLARIYGRTTRIRRPMSGLPPAQFMFLAMRGMCGIKRPQLQRCSITL